MKITDSLGKGLDRDIRKTVHALMDRGFTTTASCEGHTDRAYIGPWVDISTQGLEEAINQDIDSIFGKNKEKIEDEQANAEYFQLFSSPRYQKLNKELNSEIVRLEKLIDQYYKAFDIKVSKKYRLYVNRSIASTGRLESAGNKEFQKVLPFFRSRLHEKLLNEMKSLTNYLNT